MILPILLECNRYNHGELFYNYASISFPAHYFLRIPFWLVSALLWISITRYINRDYAEIREIMKSRAIDQLEQKH